MRDITLADTFYHFFTTRAFATGVPTTLAGTPVLSVLEENNVTPITAGVSLQVDRASVVGLNQATIVATGANGFEAAKSYAIYISTGTVGGVSVIGEVVGEFTIGASAAAVDLANVTDGLGAIKTDTAAILVDTGTTLDGRIPAALVAGRMDSSVGAMAADTITASAVAVGAIAADALSTAAANKIADQTLRRTYANARASADGDAVNFRSLLGAIGKLVNKWSISGTTLTVFQEDDVTSTAPGGTQALTATAGADPITAVDTT